MQFLKSADCLNVVNVELQQLLSHGAGLLLCSVCVCVFITVCVSLVS